MKKLLSLLVLFFAYKLNFSAIEICIVILAIAIVIISEMLNTAIEFALDSIYHNRYSKMVGMAKDISAGAVMFSSVIAVVIGVLLFGAAILKFFSPL